MLTSVIYQNDSRTTTLLDLPASVENGQCLRRSRPIHEVNRIFSTKPPEQPYPSLEPKGLKRAKLQAQTPRTEQEHHDKLQALISDSLREIRSALGERQWLRPRQTHLCSLEQPLLVNPGTKVDQICSEPPVILSSIPNVFSVVGDIADRMVSNPSNLSTSLMIDSHAYLIPPRSTFILSDVRRLYPPIEALSNCLLPGSFDLIIMDPPWQNRSVRHANVYKTSENRTEDPFLHVLPVLESHLRADGLVGIWVTNKASIRQLVLSSLHEKGFGLYEEWVWMKTTINGDPVTALDGLWRRPYEVLLLFRKRNGCRCRTADASDQADISICATGIPYRIFVAVPNHHSQKPCLKEFIEPLLADPTNYRALEIFARNLTADWFCWGDEVLKFSWEGHWGRVGG